MINHSSIFNIPTSTPQGVKKFYLLDYFLILLQSCTVSEEKYKIFIRFKSLKEKERLGESKYKKLIIDEGEKLSDTQVKRYIYTFDQVISESINCGLIKQKNNIIKITKEGEKCLYLAEQSKRSFYDYLLKILENQYFAFYHLVKLSYKRNKNKNGLMIFPIYSPRKLGFDKKGFHTVAHLIRYSKVLRERLESDIKKYIGIKKNLIQVEKHLINKLKEDGFISDQIHLNFNPKKYNAIISRFRRFWLDYFLKELYQYPYSFNTFNIWVERGKQLGVIHSTEFYPNFDGRLVYPTSIITKENRNLDLVESFNYQNNENLFIHKPNWNHGNNQNIFFEALHKSYFDLRDIKRSNFIRISDLREKVCYRLRIPSYIFNNLLQEAYNENIKGETKIQISLEADRLPHETNAMYLKREPVIINNQQKNIIAIDYNK